jgi:hypothetical protein
MTEASPDWEMLWTAFDALKLSEKDRATITALLTDGDLPKGVTRERALELLHLLKSKIDSKLGTLGGMQ